jgi:hypothetical protein
MRSVAIILICLMAGCSQPNSEPAAADSSAPPTAPAPAPETALKETPPPAPALGPETALKETGLYTDDEIRKLAKSDIDKNSGDDLNILRIPSLDVVPLGESHPRSKVFKTLNIDVARIRDFRQTGFNNVVFLRWQVSASYDICCMTAINDPDNYGRKLTDPKRKVYGIRLLKRPK